MREYKQFPIFLLQKRQNISKYKQSLRMSYSTENSGEGTTSALQAEAQQKLNTGNCILKANLPSDVLKYELLTN